MSLNKEHSLRDTGISNAFDTVDLPRHRWYYYKEGFSPSLVESAIEDKNLKNSDLLIDPFNGSGTVTLTAAKNNIHSVGFEVNPFTSFLSRAKVLNPNKEKLKERIEQTSEVCEKNYKNSYLEGYSTFTRHKGTSKTKKEKWLFNTKVIRTFSAGLDINQGSDDISQLMRLSLINAAMCNCNGKRDGKCLRYKSNWKDLNFNKDSFIESFRNISAEIEEDINERIDLSPKIVHGDARELIKGMKGKFKLCVTSPPYLNTFDYTDIYRPELFLGEFTKSSKELYDLRFKTVRSHVQVKWDRAILNDFGSLYRSVYKEIEKNKGALMNKNILPMIVAYFEDMRNILQDLRAKATDDASLWLVVSTSAYANKHVPVDLILADIGTQVGWKLREIGVLREIRKRKTKHSPDITKLRESVVILDADKS